MQRLTRGRRQLQERMLEFVESTLERTNPGPQFTLQVQAAIPLLAGPLALTPDAVMQRLTRGRHSPPGGGTRADPGRGHATADPRAPPIAGTHAGICGIDAGTDQSRPAIYRKHVA